MQLDFLSEKRSEELKPILKTIREFINTEVIPFEQEARGKGFRSLIPALQQKRNKLK